MECSLSPIMQKASQIFMCFLTLDRYHSILCSDLRSKDLLGIFSSSTHFLKSFDLDNKDLIEKI